MSLRIKGIEKLLNGSANKLNIKQEGNSYLVTIKNNRLSIRVEEIICDSGDEINHLKNIVSMFLKNMKVLKLDINDDVCGLTNVVKFRALGNKEMFIQVDNDNSIIFDEIFSVIVGKYTKERNRFVRRTDEMIYNLELGGTCTEYGYEYNSFAKSYEFDRDEPRREVKLSFYSDGQELLGNERQFISNLVISKLSNIGTKAKILDDDEMSGIKAFGRKLHYYICCGDMIISFPNEDEFLFMFSVVEEYNKMLDNGKKRVKKEGE